MPDRGTVCGDPAALSEIDKEALRDPVADGVNVTEIVQFPPLPARLLPQLLVCEKSPEFVPVMLILEIVRLWFPELVSVTVCAVLVVLMV